MAKLNQVKWKVHQREIYDSVIQSAGFVTLGDEGEVIEDTSRPLIVCGGVGVTKSSTIIVALYDLWYHIGLAYSNAIYLVFAMTYSQLRDAFIANWRENIPSDTYNYNQKDEIITLAGTDLQIWMRHSGSYHEGASADMASRTRRGASITGYYCPQAESVSRTFFDEIHRRTRHMPSPKTDKGSLLPYRIRALDCNPDAPTHWIHERFVDKDCPRYIGKNAIYLNYETLPETSVYSAEEREEARKTLPDHEFQRMWCGKWVAAAGAIYKEYTFLPEKPNPSDVLELWLGMDPGTATADKNGEGNLGLVLLGRLNTNEWAILEGELHTWGGIDDLAIAIERLIGPWGGVEKLKAIVKDWRGGSGEPIKTELRKRGYVVVSPSSDTRSKYTDVSYGIVRLYNAFKTGLLKISPSCIGIKRDLQMYVYKDDSIIRDAPDKRKYDPHRLDALRYAWIRIYRYIYGPGIE